MKTMKLSTAVMLGLGFTTASVVAQEPSVASVPDVNSNLLVSSSGSLYFEYDGTQYHEVNLAPRYTLHQMKGNPSGTDVGIEFDFGDSTFAGTLYYGFVPEGDSRHPFPVFFRTPAPIRQGKAAIDIRNRLSGYYDMVGWGKSGRGVIGYRVANDEGDLLYDGRVSFRGTGPFEIGPTLVEGPFVNRVTPNGAVISFETNEEVSAVVVISEREFSDTNPTRYHEIPVSGLAPNTEHEYVVAYADSRAVFSFKTAPNPGTRSAFTFSYSSDSRSGQGGGERDLHGTNFYVMRKIMALNAFKEVAFTQFSGDLINGYLSTIDETDLQYANWKRAVEPYWHYFPVYVTMGNHEALIRVFADSSRRRFLSVDRFPYEAQSAEAVFARNFVSPENGPASEDGAIYDPNPNRIDFPSYEENVFYYTYDNVAMIVLNSDYWYAPSTGAVGITSGNIHGFIMDNQLRWFEETVAQLEQDENVDHVFVTLHTPFFPNGGHVIDDMWYSGDFTQTAFVAGVPLKVGIIQRRDQLLDVAVNRSRKVLAILTGDEHNYNLLELTSETDIYPEDYPFDEIDLSRTMYQVNNGAAGAPYYAQERTPWTPFVSGFTTQNALVFFHVDGSSVEMEVLNPDTLEEVMRRTLR
jgi:hypothetical protein